MSQQQKLISIGIESPEDDESDYAVQSAQDRLKRRIFQRKLMICVCVCLLAFLIVAGIVVGVLLGATDNDKSTAGNATPNTTTPSNGATTSTAGNVIPTPSTTTPSNGATTSTASNVIPTPDTTTPSNDATTSTAGNVIPTPDTTTPSNNATTSTAGNVIPTPDTTTPSNNATTSTAGNVIPTPDTTTLLIGTTTSNAGAITPAPSPTPSPPPPNIANSKVLDYINTYYDPCEDFYKYSCGNWRSTRPEASEWGTFNELALDNYNKLAGYLSQHPNSGDPHAIKKVKYIYSACTDTDYIQDNLVDQIEDFMDRAGGWRHGGFTPSSSWSINSSLYKDHYLGSSAFFSFGIFPDDLNSSKQVIRIYQDGLTLGSPEKYFDTDNDLESTIYKVLNALDPHGSHYSVANDIADFEYTLASHWISETELRNLSATYNPMTLNELKEIFSMDWVSYFNNFFEKTGYTGNFTDSSVVIVNTPSYFRAVNRYLTRSAVEDYAKWQLLVDALSLYVAPLPNDNWKILRDVKFPKTSKLSDDTKLTCVEFLEAAMPLAVARPFVEEVITNSTENKVGEVARQIKIAFKERISEKDWLDETTKSRSKEKVDAITEQIAYPDFIKIDRELDEVYADLHISSGVKYFSSVSKIHKFLFKKMISNYFKPTDKTEWLSPPTQVNAYYSPEFNQFVILAGILRPPFFATNWSPFLVYGALGTVIGHELSHGFDDQGQQYNKFGNRVKWWTNSSIHNFKERTQCFVNQYNQYSMQGYRINGQLTLGENIADNGGIHTAFRAYKNVMNGTSEQYVEGHPGDQLFFVAFAQLWCSTFTDDALELDINTDPHSPGPIRILGSLVNSEDFSNTFQCSRGSKMYPTDDRCELW